MSQGQEGRREFHNSEHKWMSSSGLQVDWVVKADIFELDASESVAAKDLQRLIGKLAIGRNQ